MDRMHWRCLKGHDHYLIICKCDVFEICEPIGFDLWGRTIERAWMLRRVFARLTHAMIEITEKANGESV